MINLITAEVKKKIQKIITIKLEVTTVLVVGIGLFFVTLTIIPVFIFSTINKKEANERLEVQKNSAITHFSNTELIIEDLIYKIEILRKSKKDSFVVSESVIEKIVNQKTNGIKIKSINYHNNFLEGRTLQVQGIASNRSALLSFKNVLEQDEYFSQIYLPISNFIVKTNINFNLILTYAN